MKKKLFKTVIEIEVLSSEPMEDKLSLDDVIYECDEGSFSGVHNFKSKNISLVGEAAVIEVRKQGTDLSFFEIDDDGNECDDY